MVKFKAKDYLYMYKHHNVKVPFLKIDICGTEFLVELQENQLVIHMHDYNLINLDKIKSTPLWV